MADTVANPAAVQQGCTNGICPDADEQEGTYQLTVLVTDGQVGNEDQILRELTAGLRRVRVHTVGIDQGVNAGFLARVARCRWRAL